jgi:hypothetical protein
MVGASLEDDHTPQQPARRAIVCFVEDRGPLVQQVLALHRSWRHVESPDTDLVVMGPHDVLERLPDDIVKIAQRAVADDPEWGGYRYANALAHLNGAAARQLDRYSHILHTEADTFITPAWNTFYPTGFVCGHGGYDHDAVRPMLGAIAADFGLVHRGLTNVGVSWYGPTALVRRVSALAEMLARYILERYFATDPGAWPGWYRGVTHKYAGELAINHCVPEAQKTEWLDVASTSRASTRAYPHIHCSHTDEKFSKHWFMGGRYTDADAQHLDLDVIADYCMAMAFRTLDDPSSAGPPEAVGQVSAPREVAGVGRVGLSRIRHAVGARPAKERDPQRPELTIGMATYQDFEGVYFTIQALRLYQDLDNTELLVIDNYGDENTQQFLEVWPHGQSRYVLAKDVVGTAAPRDLVFRQARGEAVLCCDSHVLFVPGAIARLKQFYRDHPDCVDLLQGPLVYDDVQSISTHFEPVWREQMWGTWATDPRGLTPDGEPFDIPMQGLGIFSCRKDAWLGFNPRFRGFGGEEGYIHEKFRQAGRRCLCLPWLRWMHRFIRPAGVPYPLTIEDKLRNYLIGHAELGLPLEPIVEHFLELIPNERVVAMIQDAFAGIEACSTLARDLEGRVALVQ